MTGYAAIQKDPIASTIGWEINRPRIGRPYEVFLEDESFPITFSVREFLPGYVKTKNSVYEIEVLREMPAWKKLELVADLCEANRALMMAGLRARCPEASEDELHRQLMELLWGETKAAEIWGPRVSQQT